MTRWRIPAALGMTLLLACGRTSIDRAHWQHMSPDEKTLYVHSLLGHEQARASKGGNPPAHPRPADEYVRAMDAAYARGESRDADTLFDTMSTPPR